MARVAIVNLGNGQVLGDTELDVADSEMLLAECAKHVAPGDTAELRRFRLYRLRMWDGMTEAEYYTLPRSVEALEASGAVLVADVEVPASHDFIHPWGGA
jgi:hypothetical protein